jgi:hypothetical protein
MNEQMSPEERIQQTHAHLSKKSVDRRGFLTGAGKLVGAGALAMALTGTQFKSIFANHLGSDGPDLEPGNETGGDPNIDDPTLTDDDCYDFDQDGDITDFDIVQYALFLEHLEAAFYRQGLEAFSVQDFQRGMRVFREGSMEESGTLFSNGRKVREHVERVGNHEEHHAEDLAATLGSFGEVPLEECDSYNFDFSSVESFMRTAQLLENTGVAAYVGAASCIQDSNILRVAASIATVEARHAAYFDLMTANRAHPSPYDLARPMVTTIDFVLESGLVGSCSQPSGAPQPPFGR